MTSEEFVSVSQVGDITDADSSTDKQVKNFLSLNLRYDPYSLTADDDYEELKEEIDRFDIVGMLASEIEKSRVHQALVRKLINAVKYLVGRLACSAPL